MEKYDEVDALMVTLEDLLDDIPNYAKDDIEILKNNILTQKYIGTKDLEKAESYLNTAFEQLQKDTQELVWKKDIYIAFNYAQLYKERMQYDEAIIYFEKVLERSNEIGFKKAVYEEVSEIYKEKGDIELYSQYHQLSVKN